MKKTKKFIYLISPNKIKNNKFYSDLIFVFKSKKISFFQLRLKKESSKKIIKIGKKIKKICKKYNVNFIINDDPILAKKLNADGCHLGQKDMKINFARKILKKKIIGITCHNSIKLPNNAIKNNASYIAFGSFFKSKLKQNAIKANLNILKWAKKKVKKPIVAIGGINSNNYQKLLLNKASFLAISSYIWKNKKLKPIEALISLIL